MTILNTGLAAVAALALSAAGALAQANLTAETSSAGNSPHTTMLHVAEISSEAGIANFQVQEGQVATNSVVNVAEGKTDYATAPMILTFLLNAGRGPYAAQGEKGAELASNLRALYPYNAGAFALIALESEGITSYDDLKGKNVWNGPPRGAALVNARQVIALSSGGMADGEDYTGHQTNWGQLAQVLVDGSMDAFVVPTTFPSDRVTTLQSAGDVVIVSTPKDVFESDAYQKLFNAPGNVPIVIAWEDMGYGDGSGVRLISEDGVFRGMGTAFADLVNKDMDFDLVKSLVANYIANLDRLKAKTAYMKNVNAAMLDEQSSGFCGVNQLKYHPGAVAAWEEAGYTVPDCAKPAE